MMKYQQDLYLLDCAERDVGKSTEGVEEAARLADRLPKRLGLDAVAAIEYELAQINLGEAKERLVSSTDRLLSLAGAAMPIVLEILDERGYRAESDMLREDLEERAAWSAV